MQKRILSVQDISCFGKCSTTAALPILSALGHECVVLPTALLSTHTGGFRHYTFLDLTDEMRKILAHWRELSIRFDAVQTGYFAAPAQMAMVREFLEGRELLRFIDPVLGDGGALYSIYDDAVVEAMRAFCRGADVITPNVTEAALLTGIPYDGDHYDPAAHGPAPSRPVRPGGQAGGGHRYPLFQGGDRHRGRRAGRRGSGSP